MLALLFIQPTTMGVHDDAALPANPELGRFESLSSTEKDSHLQDVKEKTDVESFGVIHEDVDETIIQKDEDVALEVRFLAFLSSSPV